MPTIALLATENCMLSSITGPLDLFSIASSEWLKSPEPVDTPLFQTVIVAPLNRDIKTFNGLPLHIDTRFTDNTFYDIIYVPVILGDLQPILNDKETIDWLYQQGRQGACLCSVCAGAFLLAQTGLLNGKRATTHWHLAEDFARQFPEVILQRDKMIVDEGNYITAGGVSAYLDLALYLVARLGSPTLAASLSKLLLIDPSRRLQLPYQSCLFKKDHGDTAILAIQEWLDDRIGTPLTIRKIAEKAKLGERTFMRRFKKATGESPLVYLQQLRMEEAKKLLETSRESVEEITWKSGYEDASSFRKLFLKYTGLTPSAYRKKFSQTV